MGSRSTECLYNQSIGGLLTFRWSRECSVACHLAHRDGTFEDFMRWLWAKSGASYLNCWEAVVLIC